MWIKICGMRDAMAISAALEAGVDAVGWVFADSPRRVQPAEAARLAAAVRARCALVAVTLHPAQSLVDEIVRELQPDYLQSDAADLARLRLPRLLQPLPVLRDADVSREPAAHATLPARLLLEGPRSGHGATADWGLAAQLALRTELILAGGLNAQNVAEAIQRVRPFGVDVSSGVERAPAQKSAAMIAEFVAAARAAAEVAA
ncbi:MAG TPA: phosphoribosylanthranilate isomerase [Steroidobacteraceae bacterium]|jgi:phosphoribosylanthranilate isomerase|nr:phosphoribosylanthranilate isomerase [Steroidobacteraceae bacterium]